MKFGTLVISAVAVLVLPTLLSAAPPANDKLAKAIVLKGISGNVNSTNVMASLEDQTLNEPRGANYNTLGATVWYSYTAPANGFLQIKHDATGSGGNVAFDPFFVIGNYFQFVDSPGYFDSGTNRQVRSIPFTKGQTYKLQFDSGMFDQPGTFTFSYEFITGGGFKIQDPPHPTTQYPFTFSESDAAIEITVGRIGSTEGTATVDYALAASVFNNPPGDPADDLTVAGSDALSGTLSFAPGESRKTLTFVINDDATTMEGREFFVLDLANASTGSVILNGSAEICLEDNDSAPTNDDLADAITLTGDFPAVQAIPDGVATVEHGEPKGLYQSVWYRWTAPSDGVTSIASTGNLALNVVMFTGTSFESFSQVRPVTTEFDSYTNYPEGLTSPSFAVHSGVQYTIALLGADSTGGTTNISLQHRGVHHNDNTLTASTFRFAQRVYDVLESAGSVTVTVQRGGNTTGYSEVDFTTSLTTTDPEDQNAEYGEYQFPDFATPGEDYTVKTQVLHFDAGETEKQIQVTITPDTKKEKAAEHFFVRLGSTNLTAFSRLDAPDHAAIHVFEGKKLPLVYFNEGTYVAALVPDSGPGGEGAISLKLNHQGTFTGTLVLDGVKFTLKDSLTAPLNYDPTTSTEKVIHFTRTGLPDVVLTLHYEYDQSQFPHLTGTVTDGTSTANFAAQAPEFFGKYNPQPVIGTFTVVLTPDMNVPAAIRVPGFLSLEVKSKGTFTYISGLPDGTKLTGSGFMSFAGYINGNKATYDAVFSTPLYKNTGHLTGVFHLTSPGDPVAAPEAGDGSGSVRWYHPVVATGPVLTAFGATMDPFISRFTVPTGGLVLNVTAPSPLSVAISGGGLTNDTILGTFGAKSAVTFTPAPATKPVIKFIAKTGLFAGAYTPTTPSGSKALVLTGAVSRNRNDATGNFLNGSTGGSVFLSIPAAP